MQPLAGQTWALQLDESVSVYWHLLYPVYICEYDRFVDAEDIYEWMAIYMGHSGEKMNTFRVGEVQGIGLRDPNDSQYKWRATGLSVCAECDHNFVGDHYLCGACRA